MPSKASRDIIRSVERYGRARIIISYGFWGAGGTTLGADALQRALAAGSRSAIPPAWVAPASMLDSALWQVLEEAWGRAAR